MSQSIKQSEIRTDSMRTNDEIDLKEITVALWEGKWLLIAIAFLFSLISVIYAVTLPNIYKSEALLSPVEQDGSNNLSALAGQFGGLASLAGVDLGGSSNNKAKLAIEILKSRKFITSFIERHEILPDLMAAKSWDIKSNTIIYDDDIYSSEEKKWVREVELPFKQKPSYQEGFKEFEKIFYVGEDKETGMVTIFIEHVSPYVAQNWVNWLIQDINSGMKERDVKEAELSTEFLTKQLENTDISEIQSILYQLIEEQAKTIMFANVREEYVFKTIDPALVMEEKEKPKRALICILGAFLGSMLGAIIVLVRHFSVRKY